jgi:hypothetical protein
MWLLTSFWRTLVAGTVLLGLIYIPSDIKGLPAALRAPLGFVVTYKETLILLYAMALTLWMAWRDARPHLKPHIATVFGRQPRSEVIAMLDDYLAEGVALRNIVMSEKSINLATETAQFQDWDAAVTGMLSRLSLRERSYFRTLDRFEGQCSARETSDPERSHLEMIWNEKLRRLREATAAQLIALLRWPALLVIALLWLAGLYRYGPRTLAVAQRRQRVHGDSLACSIRPFLVVPA